MSRTVIHAAVTRLTQVLLACSVLYAALYVILNESRCGPPLQGVRPAVAGRERAVRDGSPARPFLTAVLPVWPVLIIAFGIDA